MVKIVEVQLSNKHALYELNNYYEKSVKRRLDIKLAFRNDKCGIVCACNCR